jgi:hypothetical protein
MKLTYLCVVAALGLGAIGCKKSQETIVEKATGGKVKADKDQLTVTTDEGKTTIEQKGNTTVIRNEKGDKVVIKSDGKTTQYNSKEGTFTVGEGKVPAGFPLAVMPKAKIEQSTQLSEGADGETFHLAAKMAAPFDDVVAFHEKDLKDKGLKVEKMQMSMDDASHTSLSGKSDQMEAAVVVMKEKKANDVTVILTCKRKK